jgi:hypothetical protein
LPSIEQSEKLLQLPDAEIEVEYQGRTIEKYALSFVNGRFQLRAKQTDCVAKDHCGIPVASATSACTPGSGCC